MSEEGPKFIGKFRGIVIDNVDPERRGRLLVRVQDVLETKEISWALPALPYVGKGVGLFLIPPIDSRVWVEFEHGNTEYPIWAGGFWEENEAPASPAVPDMKVLKTNTATITLNDTSGAEGITIETKKGMKIKIDNEGIEITNGQGASVKLSGPQVSINGNAFEVT